MTEAQKNYANMTIAGDLKGYFAPASGSGKAPGVVVVMEAFGLTKHIAEACDGLAAAGISALAPDIYHGLTVSYQDMDQIYAKIRSMDDEKVLKEIGLSLDFLAAQSSVDGKALGVSGYCMGGRYAFLAACRLPDRIRAAVAFYGGGIAPEGGKDRLGRRGPIADVDTLSAPILLVYGGEDGAIPPDERLRIIATLSYAGKTFSYSLYPQAGHGFCCAERESFHPSSARFATDEEHTFLERHLRGD